MLMGPKELGISTCLAQIAHWLQLYVSMLLPHLLGIRMSLIGVQVSSRFNGALTRYNGAHMKLTNPNFSI